MNQNETAPNQSERSGTSFGKNLLIFGSENAVRVHFSGNIVIIIVQSGLKPYDFTVLAAGVETEQDCNPFAQRRHHVLV